jgi:superfamily I DNA/RNA helicase
MKAPYKPSFTPTDEQVAIVEAATQTTDNLLISALAGAAKSSTLELIAWAMPKVDMLYLAFNKNTADEMKAKQDKGKLPPNFTAQTLNSLGHRAWASAIGRRLTLQKDKCGEILKGLIDDLPSEERTAAWESYGTLLRMVSHAKGAGHVPDSIAEMRKNTRLMSDEQLIDSLDEILSPLERDLLLRTLRQSMDLAFEGTVDFNDQLLMPTVFRASFPPINLILVDESQDLSLLNHAMLQKLFRRRIIAVGDQNQAIYAFRGAHEEGMAELKARFSMRELTLSTTFRCPPAIVEHVRWRAPHIQAWSGHPFPGEVRRPLAWSLSDIPEGAAVICRNNAPLFGLAVALLKSGRYPKLWGNDIGAGLLKVMQKFGPGTLTQAQAQTKLREWRAAQEKRVKNKSALADKVSCIAVFLDAGPTLGDAIAYAEHIFRSQGKINLMTGHKSKGHEFDHVFFLEEHLLRDEGQDLNLRYVICTRAKQTLTYIEKRNMEQEDE